MSLQGAEAELINEWIRATLLAYTPLTDLVADRIHLELAPDATDYPFVIFNAQSPPRVIRGVGLAVVMVDAVYQIKAVGRGDSYTQIAPIAAAIKSGIERSEYQAVPDGYVFTCSYERQVMYGEPKGQVQARHLGGEYRVFAQAS